MRFSYGGELASFVWREARFSMAGKCQLRMEGTFQFRMAGKCGFSKAGTEVQLKLTIASYLQRENTSSTSWKHKFHMVGKREKGQFRCG